MKRAELGDRARRRRADVAGGEQRLAPVERQIGARRIRRVEPIERAAEQARRRAAGRRARARAGRPPRGSAPRARRGRGRARRSGRARAGAGAPARDASRSSRRARRPRRRAPRASRRSAVQLGARALQQAPVGGVADQHVVEAQRRLAEEPAGVGLDQLAAPQRFEPRVEVGRARAAAGARRAARENCRPTTAARSSTVRSSGRSRSMRAASSAWMVGGISSAASSTAGDPAVALALERAVLHQHAHQLADEERIALAGGEHAAGDRGRQLVGADHVGGEPGRRAGVETGERHHVGDEAAGVASDERASRSSGRAADEHEQRHVGAPLHQVLDQVEQQRLGPLQVVDREHHRLRRGERGEEAADDEEGLLGRRRRAGEQRGDAVGDAGALGVVAGQRPRRSRRAAASPLAPSSMRRQRAQRLGERREGGAAGRVAARASAPSPRRRAGARTRRAAATCRGPASRGSRRGAPPAPRPPRRRPPAGAAARRRVRRTAVAGAPAGRSSDTTRYAATVSARPFSARAPNGASVTSSPTRRRVDSPISTSPSCASCCRRAATLTGSPTTSAWSSLTTTSPVLTATRSPMSPTDGGLLAARARGRRAACRPRRARRGSRRPRPRAARRRRP